VNIKKGQFAAPWDMEHAVEKCRATGQPEGFRHRTRRQFRLQQSRGRHEIASHPAQVRAGGFRRLPTPCNCHPRRAHRRGPAASGGQPEFIPVLSRAAVAAGVDGIFMEVHDHPKQAKSDGANALDLKNLRALLTQLLAVHAAAR